MIFIAHDFFQPQPVKDATVFLLKAIIHDWSDEYASKILNQLREAATTSTKLIVMDRIIPYACRMTGNNDENIPGYAYEPTPEPLPANKGAGEPTAYGADLNVSGYIRFAL